MYHPYFTYGTGAYYFDPTYFLLIAGLIISLIAQAGVSSAYRKYSGVRTRMGISSVDAARLILSSNGIYNVNIEASGGALSDHFDPRHMVIRLANNPAVMDSVAAVAVAAHECGHAIQHASGYFPLKLRAALAPVVNIASNLALPLLLVGWILGYTVIAEAACIIFGVVVAFQIVTLPVELNASKRALKCLEGYGIMGDDELYGAKKVLRAAAFTYLAATLVSLFQFLRFFMLAKRRR